MARATELQGFHPKVTRRERTYKYQWSARVHCSEQGAGARRGRFGWSFQSDGMDFRRQRWTTLGYSATLARRRRLLSGGDCSGNKGDLPVQVTQRNGVKIW